jgi:hypothetical protein
MSVEYQIDRERGVVLTRCWGTLTVTDMREVAGRLRDDPDFRPDHRQLIDLSEVDRMAASFDAIYHFAVDNGDPFSGSSRRAVVAPQHFMYGIARMYQGIREDKDQGRLRVYRTLAEAHNWLALGPVQTETTPSRQ